MAGRALHRKQLTAAQGCLAEIPVQARWHARRRSQAPEENPVDGRPFGGIATGPVFGAGPMACGPGAVRVRLVPATTHRAAKAGTKNDWNVDFSAHLATHALRWDLQLQPFVREALTR